MTRWTDRLEAPLTPSLARRAGLALAVVSGLALLAWIATAPGGLRGDGSPLGADFSLFHAAGRMALQGRLAQAYDGAAITAVERAATPGMSLTYLWRYPPCLALVLWPLGALPYLAALAVWSAAGLAAFVSGVRRLLPGRDGLLLALGAPAVFVCLINGQTALFTAAALAWGLHLLDRRPALAGAALALLACKPHFAVLPPLLLLAGGRWRALTGFTAGVAVLVAASAAAFGVQPWIAFVRAGSGMGRFLEQGGVSWSKAPSVLVAGLSLHAPLALCWALQGAVSLAAIVAAGLAWRRPGPPAPGAAALAAVAMLTLTPYVLDYDLTILCVAAAALFTSGATTAPGVRLALAAALATPGIAPALAQLTGVQLGCAPLLALLAVAARAYWSGLNTAAGSAASSAAVRFTARTVG